MPDFASPPATTQGSRKQPPAIADYGVIGDCRSAALVSRDGSIDWLCWPRFDSPSVFAAILDQERGGYWSISPTTDHATERRYISESNVLETTFKTHSGEAILTDLMPAALSSARAARPKAATSPARLGKKK